MTRAADLSVVLATDRLETIARPLACLRAQTARHRLEVVLVSLSGEPLGVDLDELVDFAAYRLVEPPAAMSLPAGRAAGVRAAGAPFVLVGETHAFPHPDLAERLLDVLGPPWTAVISGFGSANPDGAISWSNLIADYGPWLDDLPGGEIDHCPPYNTAFERAFAVQVVERNQQAFAAGFDTVRELHAGGHRIFFQPAAKVDHVNVSIPEVWLRQRFVAGRAQAGIRTHGWTWRRRLVYALGSPLLPAVLVTRCVRPFIAARRAHQLPRLTAPALVVGVVATVAGELTTFVLGASPAAQERADDFELHKVEYTKMSGVR